MDEARMTAILDATDTFFVNGMVQVLLRRHALWTDVVQVLGDLCESLGVDVGAFICKAHGPPMHERDRVHSLDHLRMLVRRHRRLQGEKAT